jgi:hypothetical protein
LAQVARTLEEVTSQAQARQVLTLLDLVTAVSEAAESEAEVVATVTHLINTGKIRLVGNFQGADVRVG